MSRDSDVEEFYSDMSFYGGAPEEFTDEETELFSIYRICKSLYV